MVTPNFDEIWQAVKRLDAEKQRRLRNLLHALQARRGMPLTDEDEIELALLKDSGSHTEGLAVKGLNVHC
jgi:hypothetical protein